MCQVTVSETLEKAYQRREKWKKKISSLENSLSQSVIYSALRTVVTKSKFCERDIRVSRADKIEIDVRVQRKANEIIVVFNY